MKQTGLPSRFFSALLLLSLLLCSGAQAALTPVLPNPGSEPDLVGTNGLLDRYFGLENLVRIDDTLDQYWKNDGQVVVQTLAKWAGFRQSFGFIDNEGDFTSLFQVGNRRSRPAAGFSVADSGTRFRFGLDPSGSPLWSSKAADNSDGLDHMVTWRISAHRNDQLVGAYVIAWEDLLGGGDQDYNDLVLLVKGGISTLPDPSAQVVPVPAALWLMASGLFSLGILARRNHSGSVT